MLPHEILGLHPAVSKKIKSLVIEKQAVVESILWPFNQNINPDDGLPPLFGLKTNKIKVYDNTRNKNIYSGTIITKTQIITFNTSHIGEWKESLTQRAFNTVGEFMDLITFRKPSEIEVFLKITQLRELSKIENSYFQLWDCHNIYVRFVDNSFISFRVPSSNSDTIMGIIKDLSSATITSEKITVNENSNIADQLEKLKYMHNSGSLSDLEYDAAKRKLLS